MNLLRSLARIAVNHFGYEIRRVATAESDGVHDGIDPITFEYLKDRRGCAVLEVPISDLRAFRALALPLRPECHPFVRAIMLAREQSSDESARAAIESVLRDYYEHVRPDTAADVLGVGWKELPGLRAVDGGEHVIDVAAVPWSARSPAEVQKGRERTVAFEGLQNGMVSTVDEGVTNFGPVKPAKLTLEVDRLFRLLVSVRTRGFIRSNRRAPLRVAAFRRESEYKWIINSGQHRFATAAAFGIETLPATVAEVIRREDAPYWPQVASGLFTETGAVAIFDRMFDGVPAPVCQPWIDKPDPVEEHAVAVG